MYLPIAALLAATIVAALAVDGTYPYFPIEISRLLTTCPASLRTFQVGVVLIALRYAYEDPWIGLFCLFAQGLAYWDDRDHWWGHMAFVGALIGAVIAHALLDMPHAQLPVIGAAIALYMTRWVIKVPVMYWCETSVSPQRVLEIMYTGETKHPLTLHLFRVGGVLQWVAFLLMASTL